MQRVAVQIENEFGFVGPNEPYMRHLIAIAKKAFGDDHILFTTDPPPLVQQGSLRGSELLTCALSLLRFFVPSSQRVQHASAALTKCLWSLAYCAPARLSCIPTPLLIMYCSACSEVHPCTLQRVRSSPLTNSHWFTMEDAFGRQKSMNPAGQSPVWCSEF